MSEVTYTGKPCKKGHTLRYKINSCCAICARERQKRRVKSSETIKEKVRQSIKAASKKRVAKHGSKVLDYKPCVKCGCTERWAVSLSCTACQAKIRNTEYHRFYARKRRAKLKEQQETQP